MCGIFALLNLPSDASKYRERALKCAKRIRHRGPDWTGVYCEGRNLMIHHRLAIVDPEGPPQPLCNADRSLILIANGEIYNHRQLRDILKQPRRFQTDSDCEVLLYLYEDYGESFIRLLNGIFAFVLLDLKKKVYMIVRDHIGIVPLYYGWGDTNETGENTSLTMWVSSEMKPLVGQIIAYQDFPPGHFLMGAYGGDEDMRPVPQVWYSPIWYEEKHLPSTQVELATLRTLLEESVARQMMSDVPFGVLLSGGLDSSIISSIAVRLSGKKLESLENKEPHSLSSTCSTTSSRPKSMLHSFSVGLAGSNSPDLRAAKEVSDWLGTQHHQILFTVEEGLDALDDVIYHLETFDVTTVRASTPMFLMARKIKALGFKMVLSGEGSDEIFGGYLYFHKAPNKEEFHKETVRKVKGLHRLDCLRANKSTSAWGLEVRVPFLDPCFLDYAMAIDPKDKMVTKERMEKHILREAFKGYLPDTILWRQKEQFSDGVGYSWIDSLKATAAKRVTDEMLAAAIERFPQNPPTSKEGYMYRSIFESHFPGSSAVQCVPGGPSIACSTATAIAWDQSFKQQADPSGRSVLGVHQSQIPTPTKGPSRSPTHSPTHSPTQSPASSQKKVRSQATAQFQMCTSPTTTTSKVV